jgi:hypothetical protein
LKKNGFSSTRRSSDESALAHAEWGDEVHGAGGELGIPRRFEKDASVGKERGEFVELEGWLPLAGGDVFDG